MDAVSPPKAPNILKLAGITYGTVILVTLLSVVAYFSFRPKGPGFSDRNGEMMAVGALWVPNFEGAKLEDLTSSVNGDITQGAVKFSAPASATTVLTFYQTKLRKLGFLISPTGDHGFQGVKNAGRTMVTVAVEEAAGGSRGQITSMVKKEKK